MKCRVGDIFPIKITEYIEQKWVALRYALDIETN